MKIIILGAKGNLGSQLMQNNDSLDLTGLDRSDLDFLDFLALKDKLDELNPAVIINAAAYNAVDKCEEDEDEFALALRLNQELPAQLAKWCLKNKARLIHYSTDYVFSGTQEKPEFFEEDAVCPINRYGASKAAGEKEIFAAGGEGLDFYLIRTSKLFGPQGDNPFAKPSFFDIIYNLAQNRDEVTVVDEELSCFTFTPDLALATWQLLFDSAPDGIYHLVNEGPATWYEGAQELAVLSGFSAKIKPVSGDTFPRPAKRPSYSVLKNQRRPQLRPWREALREYLNQKKNI